MELGKGTFGTVVADGKRAIKTFHKLSHLLQEVIVTTYMLRSSYAVDILGYDLRKLTMTTERWSCSLRDALMKYEFSETNKRIIFRDILRALAHLHDRCLLHSDLKLSNILVDMKTARACVCDLGLSSLNEYAKIHQTARAYRPEEPIPVIGHDMFGLCVSMAELFGGVKIRKQLKAEELRRIIRNNHNITRSRTLRSALLKMCPDDPADCATASQILQEVYGDKTPFQLPTIKNYENTLPKEDNDYLFNTVKRLCQSAKINRGKRCYYCLVNHFTNPNIPYVPSSEYPIYIGAMLMIFSSLFGKPGFTEKSVMQVTGHKWSMDDLYKTIENIISDENLVNFIMSPS